MNRMTSNDSRTYISNNNKWFKFCKTRNKKFIERRIKRERNGDPQVNVRTNSRNVIECPVTPRINKSLEKETKSLTH